MKIDRNYQQEKIIFLYKDTHNKPIYTSSSLLTILILVAKIWNRQQRVGFFTYFPVRPVLRVCCATSTLFSAEQSLKVRQCFKSDMIHGRPQGWMMHRVHLMKMDVPHKFRCTWDKEKIITATSNPGVCSSLCCPLVSTLKGHQFFSCRWRGTSNILPRCFYHFHQCL